VLGPAGLAAFIVGAVATALALGAWMANTGSMLDSAKGYPKKGEESKKADESRAATLGDILGDAMKDSAAGSMMTMVKVLAAVSLVLVTFVSTSYFLR
jgi:Na+/H+-translocating membrane pyrophosphatase